MAETTDYVSFLVRIWWKWDEKDAITAPKWITEIESIQTGETRQFSELPELTRFFQKQIGKISSKG